MSIMPRKFHGPELKCGGPQMCSDCRERVRQAQEFGIENPFADWVSKEDKIKPEELLKILEKTNKNPNSRE